MQQAFAGGDNKKLKIEVVDVFVIPDYQAFFANKIDPHFGKNCQLKRSFLVLPSNNVI